MPGSSRAGVQAPGAGGPERLPGWPGALVEGLWVVTAGSGRPLVLLHGNSQDHHAFDRLVPLLARPGRLLVGIDSRAHGRSPRGSGPLTVAAMADDVAGVLDRLGLAGVDVLGFSDGGNVALELAIRHPGAVGSLIVSGANLSPDGLTAPVALEVRAAYRAASVLSRIVPRLRILRDRLWLMARNPEIDPRDLAQVDVPALVVVGERDIVRRDHTRLIADALPQGEMVLVAGAGHDIPGRRPETLADLVEGFGTRAVPS